jgi:hypothetical protein
VLPTAEARLRYTAAETVSLPEHILTPASSTSIATPQ